ncbi:MAG: GatB/YqeY domain-containing protein, partial [Candidatus Limnocylindrales bacterium]
MTLAQDLKAAMTAAMRSQDALRRDTLRMVVAAAYNAEKTARRPLTDDEVVGVLTREVRMRRES